MPPDDELPDIKGENTTRAERIGAIKADTNIVEAARYLGDNPVVDAIDRMAAARRQAEVNPFEPQSGWEAYSYNKARRESGLPERGPPGEPRITSGPYEGQMTPAQRVFDAFSAFHPTESGRINPVPTDEQLATVLTRRAPGAAKILEGGLKREASAVGGEDTSIPENARLREGRMSQKEWKEFQSRMRSEDPAFNPTKDPGGMAWEEYLARFGVGTENVPLPRPRPGSEPAEPLDPYAVGGAKRK